MWQYPLTASANCGIGLWTAICVAFSSVFGVESHNFTEKQTKVLNAAKERLSEEFQGLGPGFTLIDFRVVWERKLSVTVSAMAVPQYRELTKAEVLGIMRNCLDRMYRGETVDSILSGIKQFDNQDIKKFVFLIENTKSSDQRIEASKFIKQFTTDNCL